MNAYFLHKPDGEKTEYSVCAVCGQLARGETNFDISERCCTCLECGLPLGQERLCRSLYHDACHKSMRSRSERQRFDKAQLVADYEGPVYLEGFGSGSYGDGYFVTVDELAEHLDNCLEESDTRPRFAFCCESTTPCLDLGSVLESLTEEMFEDAIDHLHGVDDLQAAVDAFNDANGGVLSWGADYSRKVEIPS